jgi:hypothetical protein
MNDLLPIGQTPMAIKADPTKKESKKANEAIEGFEAMLVQQVLSAMESDLEGGSIFGKGVEAGTLGAVGEWELAKSIAKSLDLGIEKQIFQLTAQKESK